MKIFTHYQDCIRMMKGYIRNTVVAAAMVMIGAAGVEAGVLQVYFSDNNLRYTLYTLEMGQTEYLPLEKVSQVFHVTADIDPVDGRVVLQYGEQTASFFPGQETVIANRRSHFIEVPPRMIEGVLMVPLSFLTHVLPMIYDQDINWDPGTRTLTVGVQDLEIYDLFISPYGDYTRIVTDMNQTVSYKIIEKLPSLLIFELPHSFIALEENPLQVESRSVKHVKVIDSFGSTQIVIRLGDEFVRYSHEFLSDPPRLVVDVYNTQESLVEEDEMESGEEIIEEDIVAAPEPVSPTEPRAFALHTVVIDPGHGGSDPGILLASGSGESPDVFEKTVTLELAQKLAVNLQQRFGVRVVLTREGDDFMSAERRATIANSNRADVFVSLHVNRHFAPNVSGFEVYVMDYGSLESPAGEEMLANQSQSLDYAQAQYITRSQELAAYIANAYSQRNGGARSVVKRAPLFTLKGATMPAVHIEVGYSSNPNIRPQLSQAAFQDLLAAAITDGIAEFKKQAEQSR